MVQQANAMTTIIDLQGSLSALSGEVLIGLYTQASAASASTIILNCSKLESLNSCGIHLLIRLLISTRHRQQRLLVCGLSEHNRYILEITRLSQFIGIAGPETVVAAPTM